MREIKICPVCDQEDWRQVFQVTDHSVSGEQFNLIKCTSCGLLVTSPQPDPDNISKYYLSENYISHTGRSKGIVNFIYLRARKISLRWKQNIINTLKSGGSLLDIGCGTGEFLQAMKGEGWQISGVEPNVQAKVKAELLVNQTLFDSIDLVNSKHEIITLWHVLEHLHALNEAMDKIHKSLNTNGWLLIAVPNHLSADAEKYGEHWAGFDVPRHLWHFSQQSMVLFLQKHGFTLEKIIPMKLDAYYVSMLSEKYRNTQSGSISGLFNGFLSGLSSNSKARKSGEYSSLIYIARK